MKWVNDAVDVASGLGYVELMSAVRRLRFLYQIVCRYVLKYYRILIEFFKIVFVLRKYNASICVGLTDLQ